MQLWDGICHSQWFTKTAIILFLNKCDLFGEKIKRSHIKASFPDYNGPIQDEKAGRRYFRDRFIFLSQKSHKKLDRDVYTHYTTATNIKNLRVVMSAVEG